LKIQLAEFLANNLSLINSFQKRYKPTPIRLLLRLKRVQFVMKQLVLFLTLGYATVAASGQGNFVLPIEGTYGVDYILVNYVDWGLGNDAYDNHCLDKTYKGHQGTDFVIKHFSSMDAGVNVLAVDTGIVIAVNDGLFDREKQSDTAKKLGNYIAVAHNNKLYTYYGHLKNGSINVQIGDTLLPGSVIAKVGSSGNSSDPHLHFELWYDSSYYIDPFKGPCGNQNSYWKSTIPFDSSFFTWDYGMANFPLNLDTLKEGLEAIDTFYAQDSAISFWSLHAGLRTGDSLKIKWFDPAGNLWFEYGSKLKSNWWLYYYWTYINTPITGPEGLWKVQLVRNNSLILEKTFHYYKEQGPIKSLDDKSRGIDIKVLNHQNYWLIESSDAFEKIILLDANGKVLKQISAMIRPIKIDKSSLVPGIYILQIHSNNGIRTIRIVR